MNDPEAERASPHLGAGASLDAEYLKRKHAREKRIRDKHPRLGGLILAISKEPSSTTAFATGAAGERATAMWLEKSCGSQVLFLHNRRLSTNNRRGDIDHIAIAPSGVWVIDSKNYKGKKVEVRSEGRGEKRTQTLFVGGRNCTKFVTGAAKQIDAVTAALVASGFRTVPTNGILCFVDAQLPMFKELAVGGISVRGRNGTVKLLKHPGPLNDVDRSQICQALDALLPRAG